MAEFQWVADDTVINWIAPTTTSGELFYYMLRSLEDLHLKDFNGKIILTMYSHIEHHWIDVEGFPTVSCFWPYLNIQKIFYNRTWLWIEVQNHWRGYRHYNKT